MTFARTLALVTFCGAAALAACSGNFGAGSSIPSNGLPSGALGVPPSPTPTPNISNSIATYGQVDKFQDIAPAAGYGGAIAFPLPSPKPSGTFEPVAVGITLSLPEPAEAPDINTESGKGKSAKKRDVRVRGLVYISLLSTRDITLPAFPRFAIDVPREIAAQYKDGEFGLALFNPGDKDTRYRLAVAERDLGTPPPTAKPAGSAPPTAAPTPSAGASTAPLTPAPLGTPTVAPTLPPQRITFAGTATSLTLLANRTTVFALYALPKPKATPSPNPSGSAVPSTAQSGSASPSASTSPTANASALPNVNATASPSPQPTKT